VGGERQQDADDRESNDLLEHHVSYLMKLARTEEILEHGPR
jgi:hypothetical protein